jgi:hypothetical protein
MSSGISTKMVIPKTITVGFNHRPDTYTKKLAYVIYTDAKGVLRKELSWNGWRDKKIKPITLDNVPMSGFVLNKNVGGYKSGWNHRQAAVRIYDPRDFEFEITLENLLFILQENSSIKGKGLEGEFIYSWDGKDLVLLPVGSGEYKECANFTTKQTQKVEKGDIKEGYTYLTKDMTTLLYLGKHPWCDKKGYGATVKYKPVGPRHIFLKIGERETEYTSKYIAQPGFAKIAEKSSTEVVPDFAKEYTKYTKSEYCKKATGIVIRKKAISKHELDRAYYSGIHLILKENNKNILCLLERSRSWSYGSSTYCLYKGSEVDLKLKDGTFPIPKIEKVNPTVMQGEPDITKLDSYTIFLTTDRDNDYDILRSNIN